MQVTLYKREEAVGFTMLVFTQTAYATMEQVFAVQLTNAFERSTCNFVRLSLIV